MMFDEQMTAFLESVHSAAMITYRRDGTAHAVRIGVALVESKLWSSGTQSRLRTRLLRRDPRSTLFVFDNEWRWMTLECTVNILEGPDAPEQNLRLFRVMQREMGVEGYRILWYGQPKTPEEFLQTMRAEGRLVYEFEVRRAYGMYGGAPARS
ncbi:MAG TPA: pyridoxamine 5'-phosphate oxidase family protein [Dehalococcoidia bacterium]|nr:pyridoxamine 5'-phosphate oxidase family protein [Dehalococcoidia bacterium]